jgi:hypothetical protein
LQVIVALVKLYRATHIYNMTIKETKQQLREIGFTLKKVDDEFILRGSGIEYFTEDLQVAVDTVKFEAARRIV